MRLWKFIEGIVYGRYNKKYIGIIVRFPLLVLSFFYGFVLQARYRLYEKQIFRTKELPCSVVSVGNISLGGSGKTPTTHYIARLLQDKGFRVAVLSRGYKGKAGNKINLVSDGHEIFLNPRDSGDEPYMLARKLNGVPVLTSKDRFRTGKYAVEHFGSKVLILDDGFQHIKLKRDLDVLLLDSQVMAGNTYLFPRGILREPIKNIKRADLFLVARTTCSREKKELENTIREIKEDADIFYGNFQAKHLTDPFGERVGLDSLKGKHICIFSGIAHPENFKDSLSELGAKVIQELVYPDHHWYLSGDYAAIRSASQHVDFVVTTEKDMVKLNDSFVKEVKIFTLNIELQLNNEKVFNEILFKRLNETLRCS